MVKKSQDLKIPNRGTAFTADEIILILQIERKNSDLSCLESVCLQIYVLAVSPQSLGPALFAS